MRKLLMSLAMAASLLAGAVGTAFADDAAAPAAASSTIAVRAAASRSAMLNF